MCTVAIWGAGLREQLRRLVTLLLLSAVWPAHAQSFFDDFSSCTPPAGNSQFEPTAWSLAPQTINVNLWTTGLPTCPNWTFSGQAWLARYASGTAFPGAATEAIWLNEVPNGRMERAVTGLMVGQRYRVSADVWTDNVRTDTALGLTFDTLTTNFPLAAESGPQRISVNVCATVGSTTLSLYGNTTTGGASPVVTNARLEALNTLCDGTPLAPPAAVPVDAPWMLFGMAALLALVVRRRVRR